MKINFTKKEYRSLAELLEIADWVINAHSTSSSQRPDKYSSLIQSIYSHFKEMDCEDIIKYEKLLGEYYPTHDFEKDPEIRDHIEKFEANTFWEELINNLTNRDLLKKYGENILAHMELEEKIQATCDAEYKWAKEFEINGLERIGVIDEIEDKT